MNGFSGIRTDSGPEPVKIIEFGTRRKMGDSTRNFIIRKLMPTSPVLAQKVSDMKGKLSPKTKIKCADILSDFV